MDPSVVSVEPFLSSIFNGSVTLTNSGPHSSLNRERALGRMIAIEAIEDQERVLGCLSEDVERRMIARCHIVDQFDRTSTATSQLKQQQASRCATIALGRQNGDPGPHRTRASVLGRWAATSSRVNPLTNKLAFVYRQHNPRGMGITGTPRLAVHATPTGPASTYASFSSVASSHNSTSCTQENNGRQPPSRAGSGAALLASPLRSHHARTRDIGLLVTPAQKRDWKETCMRGPGRCLATGVVYEEAGLRQPHLARIPVTGSQAQALFGHCERTPRPGGRPMHHRADVRWACSDTRGNLPCIDQAHLGSILQMIRRCCSEAME
ncbi:hypothetical protein WOLCODRAFT_146333 [Wolfiporia cocos MD-104 SS10]|uniref:Uncharacterized protein n=1 Tax=Wolfiporia cocos (strain MD-104) TaxID=742152 RepID=A0A2H3JD18_WOLCO|nr:hypothetical protein WOLCODRAFT_146333 [Wolfiporia cocos MD-104 SS10]